MSRRSTLALLVAGLAVAGLAVAGIVAAGLLLAHDSSSTAATRSERPTLVPAQQRLLLPGVEAATLTPPPKRLALAALRGTPLVVDVWASWCTVCREEAPALARLARRYSGSVNFVGIDVQDTRGAALAFVRRYRLAFPQLFDPEATLAGDLGVFGVPTVFLVDRRGGVAATIVGKRGERVFAEYLRLLAASDA